MLIEYSFRFDLTEYYGELHCEDCLEVFTRGKWKPARMEYGNNWYLTGIRTDDFVSQLPQGYDTPIGENGARLY